MKKLVCATVILAAFAVLPATVLGQTYTYDNLGRVSSVVQPNGAKTVYYYDNVDNRTASQTATSGTITITPPAALPTVIAVTAPSNLRTLANSAGYTGSTTANYEFVVPAGSTVTGTGSSVAVDTGTWPSGVIVSLVVSGNLYGGGGTAGHGASNGVAATAGTAGTDAVYVQAPFTIIVNTGGVIAGGAGAGGGGASTGVVGAIYGGGGGGGGFPNGPGGAGGPGSGSGVAGGPGAPGTTAGGGAGGTASGTLPGGHGGNAGGAGNPGVGAGAGAGGIAGYAIRKNGNTVTITNNGTITGTVA